MNYQARHRTEKRPLVRLVAVGAAIGLCVGVVTRVLTADPSEGSHPLWAPWRVPGHLDTLNTYEDERICVVIDESVTEIDLDEARRLVMESLTWANPDEDWDGLNYGKVHFVLVGANPYFPDYCASREIEIYIQHEISPPCSSGADGCAYRINPYPDPNSGHDQYEDIYPEWKKGIIHLDADDFLTASEQHHLVNHEVGHILGFQDGGPSNPLSPTPLPSSPSPTPFPVPLPTTTPDPMSCSPPSIMHSYGCSDLEFPSFEDRFALERHIPDSGAGSGSPKGRGFSF